MQIKIDKDYYYDEEYLTQELTNDNTKYFYQYRNIILIIDREKLQHNIIEKNAARLEDELDYLELDTKDPDDVDLILDSCEAMFIREKGKTWKKVI